jgi:hypothetical protein
LFDPEGGVANTPSYPRSAQQRAVRAQQVEYGTFPTHFI